MQKWSTDLKKLSDVLLIVNHWISSNTSMGTEEKGHLFYIVLYNSWNSCENQFQSPPFSSGIYAECFGKDVSIWQSYNEPSNGSVSTVDSIGSVGSISSADQQTIEVTFTPS